jgi:hypothetical protein
MDSSASRREKSVMESSPKQCKAAMDVKQDFDGFLPQLGKAMMDSSHRKVSV